MAQAAAKKRREAAKAKKAAAAAAAAEAAAAEEAAAAAAAAAEKAAAAEEAAAEAAAAEKAAAAGEEAAAAAEEAAAPSKKAAGKKRRKVLENTKATEAAVESAESGVTSEEESTKGPKHHRGANLDGPGSKKSPERYCVFRTNPCGPICGRGMPRSTFERHYLTEHAKDAPSSMSEAEAEFCVKATETSTLPFYRLIPDKTTVNIDKMVEKQTKVMQDILDTNRAILEELRTLNRAF